MNPIKYKLLIPIIGLFGLVYGLISFVNHYYFRTYALDLGMMNHALYSFAHFKVNYFTSDISWINRNLNFLADHFSPIMFLYVPFYFLFGSYTLLIIQLAVIIIGGLGIFKYARENSNRTYLPYIILCQFYFSWAIFNALAFDFHNNVIAAMIAPWLLYFLSKDKLKEVVITTLIMLLTKESTGLWLAFVFIGWGLRNKGEFTKKHPLFLTGMITFSLAYFYIVVQCIMPFLNDGIKIENQLSRYSQFGNNLFEIAWNMLSHPTQLIQTIIGTGEIEKSVKWELLWVIVISGGFALIRKPYLIIMLVPVFVFKLLSSDQNLWGINAHYSIEFTPIIAFALVEFFKTIHSKIAVYWLASITAMATLYTTNYVLDNSKAYINKTNARFYHADHYKDDLDNKEIYRALELIPSEVTICVQSALAPHLANRNRIYVFPNIWDASYVALIKSKRGFYPLNEIQYNQKLLELLKNPEFQTIYNKGELIILQRNPTLH